MRIVFATFGSLGDLHPYIAVARELVRRGHSPLIASFDGFRESVESAGVAFAAIRPAMAGLGDPAAIMRRLVDPWRGPEYLVRELFMPHLAETYEDLGRAAAGADLLVNHPLVFVGPLLARTKNLAWVSTALSPMTLFSAFDPPVFPAAPWMRWARAFGVAPYRWVFNIPRAAVRRWERPLREFRAALGLPATEALAQFEGQFSPRGHLALFSRTLAAPQPDWPAKTVVCGFPRYDGAPPDAGTRSRLNAFLAGGEPPLVFALGSSAVMVADDFWERAIDTAGRLSRRAILITGANPRLPHPLPGHLLAVDYLPYSAVFPHALAIVHSGGIGTLGQALAAGRPQLIVPVAFDQPDNARRAAALGVARRVAFPAATGRRMAAELAALLGSPAGESRAADVARAVRDEDAAGAACDALLGAA